MMLCDNCIHREICSALRKLLLPENKDILKVFTGCKFYSEEDIPDSNVTVREERDFNDREAVSSLSAQIHALNNDVSKYEKRYGGEVIPPSEDLSCSVCHKKNVQLGKCSSCGRLICADCMTETIDGRTLCQECYDSDEGDTL